MRSYRELSIVMPVYNEVDGIEQVVSSFYDEIVRKTNAEFIVAEDGSKDGTREKLFDLSRKIPLTLFSDKKRKGYATAAKDALKRASSEYVLFSDSDGQYQPSDFWRIWAQKDNADMIIGIKTSRAEGAHRLFLSRGFHFFARVLFGAKLRDIDSGFRLVRRSILLSILDRVDKLEYSFWGEFTLRAHENRLKIVEVPIHHSRREHGKTRIYGIGKLPLIVLKEIWGLLQLKLEFLRRR